MTDVVRGDSILDVVRGHKLAFELAFGSEPGKQVLEMLAPFCRANKTCVIPGQPDLTNVLEGRREVWLRIQDYLMLTPEQLLEKIYKVEKSNG